MLTFNDIKNAVAETVSKFPVKKVVLFGSYADGTATEDSDVDVIVEFATAEISLFTILDIKYALESKLHKNIDVIHGPLDKNAMIQPGKVLDVYEH